MPASETNSLATTAFFAIAFAWFNLALMYLWLKSELLSPIQARLELSQHLWLGKLLTCGYCAGTWTYSFMWLVVFYFHNQEINLVSLTGVGAGLGLYYYLWAAFRKKWLPI